VFGTAAAAAAAAATAGGIKHVCQKVLSGKDFPCVLQPGVKGAKGAKRTQGLEGVKRQASNNKSEMKRLTKGLTHRCQPAQVSQNQNKKVTETNPNKNAKDKKL